MKDNFKNFLVLLFIINIFFIARRVQAATIYVDKNLASDCLSNNYSIINRSCTGSDGNAYNTMQEVLWGTARSNNQCLSNGDQIAQPGDTIYLRGGTYQEIYVNSNSESVGGCNSAAAMAISHNLNGAAGAWTTISSYPEEWAIIDGQGERFGFGWGCNTTGCGVNTNNHLKYIKFERLEITGAVTGGLAFAGGPVIVRYCYIHENGFPSISSTNAAGIYSYVPISSVIEYNFFKNNGGVDHGANRNHIEMYSDYYYSSNNGGYNWSASNRGNEIRYNYFDVGAHTAIHDKAVQYLTSWDVTSSAAINTELVNKDQGNKIHHNIFLGGSSMSTAVYAAQDFEQIYNNITDCKIGIPAAAYPTFWRSIYNNTVIGDGVVNDFDGGATYTSSDLNSFVANNISADFTPVDYYPAFGIGVLWQSANSCIYDYTWTNTLVDRNLVYNPGSSSRHFGLPNSYLCKSTRWITTSAFNSLRSTNNYITSASGLWAGSSGPNQYKINSTFDLGSGRNAGNGGIGGSHPYLDGVVIPSYVGAVNPGDNDWVDGVLSLTNISILQIAGSGDPDWIEDASAPSDTTPPIGSVSINSGASTATSTAVSLSLSASDSSRVAQMKVANSNDINSVSAEIYSTVKSWILSAGDGLKTVYVWFKDTVGNWMSSPVTDTITLNTAIPTCTSFTYSDWGSCQSNNTQTRTVLTSSPSGCTGGSPVTSQSCTYSSGSSGGGGGGGGNTVTCTSYTYSDWGSCQSNNAQTRTVLTSSPSGCTGGSPVTSKSCTYSSQTATSTNFNQATTTSQQIVTTSTNYESITDLTNQPSPIVNGVTSRESLIVYGQNQRVNLTQTSTELYIKIAGKETNLTDQSKYSIAYFIHYGTPTTQKLGSGERAGVIGSYKSAFNKIPQTVGEWQDVIKIANGRWTNERSVSSENNAKMLFKKVYLREPNLNNANDSNAIQIITYGLRPLQRNINSEKTAIKSFKYIFRANPTTSQDWDVVRAIAYSGAKR